MNDSSASLSIRHRGSGPLPPAASKSLVIAFAGNPNVGKTALINAIANSRLKVGNWPGVTVEKKEATTTWKDYTLRLIDLPGTYSLSPYTLEEQVCRDFLLLEKPDVVINVLDASNLAKNLYLTTQLMEMEVPMVLALNMWDEFEAKGYHFDLAAFSQTLGMPVVKTVGPSRQGVEELLQAVTLVARQGQTRTEIVYPDAAEIQIAKVMDAIAGEAFVAKAPLRWTAIKLLENDAYSLAKIKEFHQLDIGERFAAERQQLLQHSPDIEEWFTHSRNAFISERLAQVLAPPADPPKDLTDRIDELLLSRWFGIPAFLGILYMVFKLTFDISGPFIDFVDGFINGFFAKWVGIGLQAIHTPEFLVSLATNGVIGGVGVVLTFLPVLFFLYLFLAILEESGYMARAAYLMDRVMYRFGLHGKAFVPLLVGFGCNVPAVFASRSLESQTDRKITVAVQSFMSCGAKLPIYALFTAVFFQQHQAGVIMLMYLIGIAVAISWSLILRRTRFKGEIPVFIMELPPYRFPTFKMLWASIGLKLSSFVKQAGTVIAVTMILLWSLVNLPYGAPTENTVLASSARAISPFFKPLGFGERWEAVASIIPGFMAKEMVVGTLGVVLSVQEEAPETGTPNFMADLQAQGMGIKDATVGALTGVVSNILPSTFVVEAPEESPLSAAMRKTFTPLTAIAYMVFNLLLMSCVGVIGSINQEFGPRYLGFVFLLTTGTAYTISALVYNLGRLLGWG